MTDDFEAAIRAHASKFATTPEEVERLVETTLARLAWRVRHGYKVCSACGQPKKPSEFGSNSSRRDGLAKTCLACERKRDRTRKSNPDTTGPFHT